MVSIAHWLDTFTCSKYADRFERSGFQNLQMVCQLTPAQLQTLGVAPNDIYTIMENVLLLKQSLKSLEPPRYLDLNSEIPSSNTRSRTASPAISTLNRTMSQNPTSYSPGPNVSTPPTSSGPSPDRGLPGPALFDTPSNAYHRSNSYTNPVNPNTFLDISPSSSTSSPHRSGSMDAYAPPPLEGGPFNEYAPQLPQQPPMAPHPHSHPHPQFQPPGMMYRPGGPHPPPPPPQAGPGGYYNPHAPRFFAPDHPQQGPPQQGGPLPPPPPQQQQQAYMYSNSRMMMHPQQQQGPPVPGPPQQHPNWSGVHRQPHPPPPSSHPMHYHPYDQHQYRMPPAQTFHPNHPMMSDQNSMFLNQQQGPPGQNLHPSTSSKLSPTGEPHPHPLQSLERLVLLPESQVIDPKSVVNEIHDPPSPFSESLSPYGTSSPKNSVATPPTTTMVSNLLTNDKSMLDAHGKAPGGLKRGSTYDDRNELNKKNRMNANTDISTGESITNNHPVVTSLLTRGLSTNTSQAPLPSIKSLQQKHNPSFLQQQQQQQQQQQVAPPPPSSMMFPPNQPDPQQFVDGLFDDVNVIDESFDAIKQDYEQLMTKLRIKIETNVSQDNSSNVNLKLVPCQFDGLSEGTGVTSKSTNRSSRKRVRSESSDDGKDSSVKNENSSSSPLTTHQDKSGDDPYELSMNGNEKKSSNGSFDRRLSENNLEFNHSSKSPHSTSTSPKIEKLKVIESLGPSNFEQDESSSVSETTHKQASSTTTAKMITTTTTTTTATSSKPIREAKKRSLIYTGNTREFLETAIAAGLIDANGDEEDEDNEYVPPGGSVTTVRRRRVSSPSLSSSPSNSDQEQESTNDTDEDDGVDDEEEENEEEEEELENNDEEVNDENVQNDQLSESDITWNVRNRPQRRTHLIRFDNISKQDEQKFFGALTEQAPELAAYLNEESDDEYQVNDRETSESPTKTSRKSSKSTKKSQQTQPQESAEQDEQTVEIIKKFRHVRVPSEKTSKRKSHHTEKTTISSKNRSYELYVVTNDDSTRTIISGAQLETDQNGKKSSPLKSFHFHRRPAQLNNVEDPKAPYRCILCWKEPYEDYLGPLFGPYQLNEQCQTYLSQNKQLGKHYRKLKEVWFHRDCALWNNHIQMNPTTGELMHVSEACSTYLEINCSSCQQPGATLACRYRNCKIRYHYACAKATDHCRLISQSYSVYCPKHNQMINQKSKKNRRQTTTSTDDSHNVSTTTI